MKLSIVRSEKLPRRVVIAGMSFSLLVLWTLFAFDIYSARDQWMRTNREEILLRTRVLAERSGGALGKSEMILQTLASWIKFNPEADPLKSTEFLDIAGTFRKYSNTALDIRMADRAGKLHYLNSSPGQTVADVSDREYFKVQMDPRTAGFHIGSTVKSRVSGNWIVPISFPAGKNAGDIALVAVAYDTDMWFRLFKNSPSQNDQSFLIKNDGTILMSYPFNKQLIGKSVRSVLKEWKTPSVFTGEEILSPARNDVQGSAAYAASSHYPLSIISVNSEKNDITRIFRVRAVFLVLISSLIVLNAGILLLLFRHILMSKMRMQELALTDGLTGIPNRRAFETQGAKLLSHATRYPEDISLLMLDIDHFKTVNDTFGHAVGDKTLISLARAMEEAFRTSDVLGRMGGEEFAVLLPETSLQKAGEIAERFRIIIQSILLPSGKPLSISIGVAGRQNSESLSQLIEHADMALYKAKQTGRNRVVINTGKPAPRKG